MKSIRLDGQKLYPSKLVCIGRNYADHIEELGNEVPEEPVIFIKPNSAISAGIQSSETDAIHFEGEMSFVIKGGELAGVGFGLDLTKREVQNRLKAKGLPWERAKAFDGSAVFSDFVSFSGDTSQLRLELYINDRLVQRGGHELMLYKPHEFLTEARSFLFLEDGDVIMTGTPAGVGAIEPGDRFIGKIFKREKLLVEGCWLVS
jgi:2-keto-4-pentenoate hydratase/2-oxohepta-3-ene-1,7-dioic acid hydratase in catechol pathway